MWAHHLVVLLPTVRFVCSHFGPTPPPLGLILLRGTHLCVPGSAASALRSAVGLHSPQRGLTNALAVILSHGRLLVEDGDIMSAVPGDLTQPSFSWGSCEHIVLLFLHPI